MEMRMTGPVPLVPPATGVSFPHEAAIIESSVRSRSAEVRRGRGGIRVIRNRRAGAHISRGTRWYHASLFATAMKEELATRYEPSAFEQRIYADWEKGGYFTPV